MTLAEVVSRWLESNPLKRDSSRARDQSILEYHVLPAFGSRRVGQITRLEVQQLVDSWSKTYTPSTVTRMFALLRGVLTFAVTADLLARSPCAGIRLPRSTLVERPVLSAEQLQVLASELGPDQAAMMWLGVVGGLRWAECAGSKSASLDLLKGTVSVSAQLGRDGRLAAPKSRAATRRLSLPGWLINDLAAVLARRGLTAANPEEFVFVSPEGMPLQLQQLASYLAVGLQKGKPWWSSLSRPALNGSHRTRRRRRRHKDGPGSFRPLVPIGYPRHICEGDRAGGPTSGGGHRRALIRADGGRECFTELCQR